MYAIIDTGNHQEKVEVGSTIEVDFLSDKKTGDPVRFEKVLLVVNAVSYTHLTLPTNREV